MVVKSVDGPLYFLISVTLFDIYFHQGCEEQLHDETLFDHNYHEQMRLDHKKTVLMAREFFLKLRIVLNMCNMCQVSIVLGDLPPHTKSPFRIYTFLEYFWILFPPPSYVIVKT